ncbi:solute carrier family 22 member 13-like [Danaus plexippus]|uniref:solute carrier family 22 member 13-like n=1 Tax=Danaus plexippus TaxID=13037 RepID=UPI002AB2996F|nr:solute carrier family 22 member 13-like [Danaus plexippus]
MGKKNRDSNNHNNKENGKNDNESDYLEDSIGVMGIWQIYVCVVAASTRFIGMGNMSIIVFLTPITDFICIEFEENTNITAEKMVCYNNCVKYEYKSVSMDQTIVTEFDLICEREWMASFAQSVIMFGLVIGVSLFGWISDRFGRRVALLSSTILNIISMVSSAFSPDYWIYNGLRLIMGIASGGSIIVCVPYVIEICSKKYREIAGALITLPDGLSELSLALFAYYFPTWKSLTLGFSSVSVIILLLVLTLPESPRWLVCNGRTEEAISTIMKAAEWNKLETDHVRDTVNKSVGAIVQKINTDVSASYFDLFKKRLGTVTWCTIFIWAVVGTNYFGLYQYMTFLGTTVHTTVVMLALLQFPLCVFEVLLTKHFSRKATLIGVLVACGVPMLILIFTPKNHWVTSTLGVIGFSACYIAFGVIYVYHGELYPTCLRSMAYGITSGTNKVGAMASPFIARISPSWIPSSIFASLSFLAAAFCFLLPETKGSNLKDTVD